MHWGGQYRPFVRLHPDHVLSHTVVEPSVLQLKLREVEKGQPLVRNPLTVLVPSDVGLRSSLNDADQVDGGIEVGKLWFWRACNPWWEIIDDLCVERKCCIFRCEYCIITQ